MEYQQLQKSIQEQEARASWEGALMVAASHLSGMDVLNLDEFHSSGFLFFICAVRIAAYMTESQFG
jgi:hypothetical protein